MLIAPTPAHWNQKRIPPRVSARALEHIDERPNGCRISRYSTGSHGYAQIGWSEAGKTSMVLAHHAAWVGVHGPVPQGMTLDHECKHPLCVNPDHLRLLTNHHNGQRIDGRDWPVGECANGHPEDMRVERHGGGTICRPCRLLYARRNNWLRRHPGEPMPEHLKIAIDKDT
jgi:hypothetical protein